MSGVSRSEGARAEGARAEDPRAEGARAEGARGAVPSSSQRRQTARDRDQRSDDAERFAELLDGKRRDAHGAAGDRGRDEHGAAGDRGRRGKGDAGATAEDEPVAAGPVAGLGAAPGFSGDAILSGLAASRRVEEAPPSRSAELAKLVATAAGRVLVDRGAAGDEAKLTVTLRSDLFADTDVTVSAAAGTLEVQIATGSTTLVPLLRSQGDALAQELAQRLGMRIVLEVGATAGSSDERDGNRRSRGLEPLLHYVAEQNA
jgi:hypothetical protein